MPTPTTWPLMCAFGLTLMAAGVVTTLIVTVVGFLIALIAAVGWFRSVFPTPKHILYPLAEADREACGCPACAECSPWYPNPSARQRHSSACGLAM